MVKPDFGSSVEDHSDDNQSETTFFKNFFLKNNKKCEIFVYSLLFLILI